MKKIFTYALAMIMFMFTYAQQLTNLDNVVTAVKSGNASALSRYLDNTVEIELPNKSNSYSKSQAELVLKEFFSTHGVKDFGVVHKSEKEAGTQYCIGKLQTRSGNFRTTIYFRQRGEDLMVQELKFEAN